MLETRELVKTFAGPEPVRAVDHVSFGAERGEVLGLLGVNGAGKTTTLRMLVTLLAPDSGTARINGYDVQSHPTEARRSLGFLSTTTGVYDRLTVREMLVAFGRLLDVPHPKARADQLIERFSLGDHQTRRCGQLSTGNKQRVSIARAIVHDPPVIVLDEPTTGLDVLVAQAFLEFVEEMRDSGKCILYSTHIMSEAERLCDRVAVLHEGRVLADATLDALRAHTGETDLEAIFLHLVRGQS